MSRRLAYALLLPVILSAGCGSDTTAVAPDLATAFWRLTLNHHAITISTVAPYDTIQLVPTPYDANGTALPAGVVTFTASDTSVLVSPDGFVRAHNSTAGGTVSVRAVMRINGVTMTDSAVIMVTDVANPSPVETLSLQAGEATGLDSTRIDCGGISGSTIMFAALVRDRNGNIINQAPVFYTTSDSTAAGLNYGPGSFSNHFAGILTAQCPPTNIVLYASSTVYGVTRTDSVPMVINPPHSVYVSIQVEPGPVGSAYFLPANINIGVGGTVLWRQDYGPFVSYDIVFDNPGDVGATDTTFALALFGVVPDDGNSAGDITPTTPVTDTADVNNYTPRWQASVSRFRTFPKAGTYHYRSTLLGKSGVVNVQ